MEFLFPSGHSDSFGILLLILYYSHYSVQRKIPDKPASGGQAGMTYLPGLTYRSNISGSIC
ncbi:MAG: hypothetical protein Q8P40_14685, partial [Nitrospirota bacterium]|nr:hypothetical protein [Nitrospirota bacterium]